MYVKKFIWIMIPIVLFLVGCQGNQSPQTVSTRISTAPRGASLQMPVASAVQIPEVTLPPIPTETMAETLTSSESIEATVTDEVETTVPTSVSTDTPIEQVELRAICQVEQDRSFEAQVIALMNVEREKYGMAALSEQSQITLAARQHSEDMACNGFFDHVSPTTNTIIERAEAVGYEYILIGENIAAGYLMPEEVVQAWMDSESHRENILNPEYTQVGVGYVFLPGSDYGSYWTAVYARP